MTADAPDFNQQEVREQIPESPLKDRVVGKVGDPSSITAINEMTAARDKAQNQFSKAEDLLPKTGEAALLASAVAGAAVIKEVRPDDSAKRAELQKDLPVSAEMAKLSTKTIPEMVAAGNIAGAQKLAEQSVQQLTNYTSNLKLGMKELENKIYPTGNIA